MKLVVVLIVACLGTLAQGNEINPCLSADAQKSCASCIATSKECAWCVSVSYEQENRLRCDTHENHLRGLYCDPGDIQFPTDEVEKLKNQDVGDGDNPEDAVQVQPQKVRIKIRPNKPVEVKLTFRQAENYPVDLYYFMDLSNSMEDDKEKLALLGNKIAEQMSAITKNFRLGFGSFVDKVVSPYVSTVPQKLKMPCKTYNGEPCEAPYGFKNQLSLDLETTKFSQKVKEARVSGNLDAPEGGFDAIMQAVACEDEIGWRPISRRMLVFSTDAGFHHAGDGKLGGIVTPNDGQCHLKNNLYSESSNLDYPSVSQIANKIKEKSVSVIFAVTDLQFDIYEKLSKYIESSTTGRLANDSSNIVTLIEDNYKKITSKVTLKADGLGENITVDFFSRCFGGEEIKTNECGSLKIGQSVEFRAEVMLTACPKDRKKWLKEFSIRPLGYQEKLTVELEMICECQCENAENEELNSDKCSNGNGTFECGKCSCHPGRYGKFCECKADDLTSKDSIKQCTAPNATLPCSGRGSCVCGECLCNTRSSDSAQTFSGPYCECDDYSCNQFNEQICGGPERGKCNCGKCECKLGYNGTACECELSMEKCTTDKGLVCNGHGNCTCGKCVCENQYTGFKCEQCPACPDKCLEYTPCVQCKAFKFGKLIQERCLRECKMEIFFHDKIREGHGIQLCPIKDDDECWAYYTYEYDRNGKVVIKAQITKVCPDQLNVLAIVGGVVGGIVAVGLFLLLLWKLLTFIHDTREFAKFEKERQNAKWDTGENPIYKQATSTFKNPTYGSQ
ncbi:integrin beta-PS-like precursor [Biomphalaria glabrata]|uniref:Integrin beta n=1 Tax=Biomphalaria glabrata TaxID=6526 RepID=O96444_BIOGL|nr:integrin beta-PS-like precursor [Biomphalaria glabrata]AAC67503.1 beta integrin subunit [Biomphalaria glabrata]